jgi:3-methyladenine DNA glycosylase AlkD
MPENPRDITADTTALCAWLLGELQSRANAENVAGMARFGIGSAGTLGVSMPEVRSLAADAKQRLGRDKPGRHQLALALWDTGVHEARIMASVVDIAELVTEDQAEAWVSQIDSWDVCDQLCINLLRSTGLAWAKASEWTGREPEYVKRAGFVLVATMAVHNKKTADDEFLPLLRVCEREAADDRNAVKKALNWAIRQIGKRSAMLNAEAISACERILAQYPDSTPARWVARDALRELQSDAIRTRLGIA